MADVRISDLPAATTPLAGTELVPIVQAGVTRQVAASELGGGGGGASTWNDLTGTADKVPFNTSAGLTAGLGEITWNATAGTVDVGMPNSVSLQVGQEELIQVRNGTGSTITNGSAVMYTGTIGASTRIVCAPMVADGSVPPYNYLGIVTQDIASGADGYCCTFGKVRNINTLAYGEGDVLWLNPSVAGGLTPTEPAAPNVRIPAAIAINSASNGTIFVRSNSGMRLRDLSDVQANGGTTNRQVLGYVTANNRWEALTLNSTDTGSTPSTHVGSGGTQHANATTSVAGFMSSADKTKLDGVATGATANTGTVTSVALTAPTGLTVGGSPVTTSGTLALSLTAGYVIPTQATIDGKQATLVSGTNIKTINGASVLGSGDLTVTAGTATWTTAGRPGSPVTGQTGFNTTLGCNETYNGTDWEQEGWVYLSSIAASGTEALFTGIPSWVNEFVVSANELSNTGTDVFVFQIGDAGGIENTGYDGFTVSIGASAVSNGSLTNDGLRTPLNVAAATYSGSIRFTLVNKSNNLWSAHGAMARAGTTTGFHISGTKSLSAVLTQVRIGMSAAATFDSGTFYLKYRK